MNTGIYKIQSTINNKLYIGSSVHIKHRKASHFSALKLNKHDNVHLQNHYNKYGKSDLVFETIEFCDVEDLIIKEQHYIDTLNPQFNGRKIAESNRGHKFTEETKINMSIAQKEIRKGKDFSTVLTKEFAEQVLNLKKSGLKIKDICKILNTSRSNVSSIVNGRCKNSEKISDYVFKLDEQKVSEIKYLIKHYRLEDIAVKYNVNPSVISNIKANRTWKNVVESDGVNVDITNLRTFVRLPDYKILEIKEKMKNYEGKLTDLAKELNIPYYKLVDLKRNRNNTHGL